MKDDVIAIILAGGNDARFSSKKSKVVNKVLGKEMIKRVMEAVEHADIKDVCVVVNEHNKEDIKACLGDSVTYVMQKEALGSGDAIKAASEFLNSHRDNEKVLVISGDVPLIQSITLDKLLNQAIINGEKATVLSAYYETPKTYGRIIRDENSNVVDIVEDVNLDERDRFIKEINAGIYCFDVKSLVENIDLIQINEQTGKFDLPYLISVMVKKDLKVGAYVVEDIADALGVNDKVQLEMVTRILRMRINTEHMLNGVIIEDINTTYIYDDVKIGVDTVVYPNTTIKSDVEIGEECQIGPNAYIREKSRLGNKVKIGSFVEVKKVTVGDGTKIPHLSYVGDSVIGKNCNLGCGVITCNYDGKNKFQTTIGDNVFVGSNSNLVAPVTLEDDSYVGAGSTVTKTVPKGSLAVERTELKIIDGWVNRKRAK